MRCEKHFLHSDSCEIGSAEGCQGMGLGRTYCKHRHSSGKRGFDTGHGILHHKTLSVGNPKALRRESKDFRIRFGALDMRAINDRVEEASKVDGLQDRASVLSKGIPSASASCFHAMK